MHLEKEMDYRLTIEGPLADTGNSILGKRQYWTMVEATLNGPRIKAQSAAPGEDWMLDAGDGFGRPAVRLQFKTHDGAFILLHYSGLVEQSEAFVRAAENGTETKWEDQYMRMILSFETGDERYQWLMQNIFIARGRLAGKNRIDYEVYRLT